MDLGLSSEMVVQEHGLGSGMVVLETRLGPGVVFLEHRIDLGVAVLEHRVARLWLSSSTGWAWEWRSWNSGCTVLWSGVLEHGLRLRVVAL